MDENRYYDFAGMGISSCALGYADDDVDSAVKKAIDNGSMVHLIHLKKYYLRKN